MSSQTPPLAIVAFIFFVSSHIAAYSGPRIECETTIKDFGTVNNNTQSLAHTFMIRNSGDSDLQIQGVNSTCGCTTAKVGDSTLKPGATTPLSASFTLQGRKGPQRKDIRITSNDPVTPQLVLQVLCDIRLDIDTDVSGFFFNRVAGTQTISRTVILRADTNVLFNITSIDTSAAPSVSIVQATLEAGRQYALTATVHTDDLSAGRIEETVTVCTDNPSYGSIRLPVSLYKADEVMINPNELLLLDNVLKQPEVRRDIYLKVEGTNKWEFFDVEPIGNFKAVVEQRMPGKCRILLSNLSGVDEAGTLRLAVTVRCTTTGAERRLESKLRRYVPHRPTGSVRSHAASSLGSGTFREVRKKEPDQPPPRQ